MTVTLNIKHYMKEMSPYTSLQYTRYPILHNFTQKEELLGSMKLTTKVHIGIQI